MVAQVEASPRYLIIVGHNESSLCAYLREAFSGDEKVQILVDRRQGDRRQRTEPHEPERRRTERRHQPAHPCSDWFTVVRRQTD